MHPAKPAYRPDIDGIRALAVLMVIVFHAFPAALGGGFIGVDIFFVISGFLISTILFAEFGRPDAGGLRVIGDFYSRRIRRIFPSLVVVLAACYALGFYRLLPDEFKRLGLHIAASAGFFQNLLLAREAGYFDYESFSKPLLHLWSLGIEEQFYLFWPLLIWLATSLRIRLLPMRRRSSFHRFAYGSCSSVR
jgi:peptidoglycan/LPS O-acetylase OafA/YrhL